MTFSNQSVELAQLPHYEDATQISLSEKYRPMNMIFWLVLFGVVALLISAIRFQPFVSLPVELIKSYVVVMMLTGGLAILTVTYHFLADPLKRYSLREQDISYSSGLVFRKTVHQPILRIQHIELQRGPVERMAGLATLQVFSAGGAMHTFQIPGLEHKVAQNMRQFILEHKDLNTHG